MIAKRDLKNNRYYLGYCRNVKVAQWIAEKEVFIYIRNKFNQYFIEEISHPDDDKLFDVFCPIRLLELTEKELQECKKFQSKKRR